MREWTFTWTPAKDEATPTVAICPLQYDKRWAYAVEIDDGPSSTFTVSQPLLEKFSFTDAPPGVHGGRPMPFVGGAAVIVLRVGAGNETFLSWDQLRQLQKKGWAVINHGYWHSGYGWDPKGALTPDQFRDEMYWSQTVLAMEIGEGRSPDGFVYPNGYMAYGPYLKPFGLRSASRVAGKSRSLLVPGDDFLDLDRNYLDESVWKQPGDPLVGLPSTPKAGDFIIDFTHGMEADPQSANHRRWKERLTHIASHFGQRGDDSVWCAPTPAVIDYVTAARAAVVRCQRGRVTVTLPADLPGTRLTIRLTGIAAHSKVEAQPGGMLYRQGDQVWITTPVLGSPGVPAPQPLLKRIYVGPVRNVTLPHAARMAAIRLRQHGEPKPGALLKISLVTPDGKPQLLINTTPHADWGAWQLYPIVPNRPPILAVGAQIEADPAFQEMEIWVVAE